MVYEFFLITLETTLKEESPNLECHSKDEVFISSNAVKARFPFRELF